MTDPAPPTLSARSSDAQIVETLFDLGRQVTSVLQLDELLQRIPDLIARLVRFDAFAVYLYDERKGELRIGYGVGYPDEVVRTLTRKIGEGLIGVAVAEGAPILCNDVGADPRYREAVPGMAAELVAPLFYKKRPIGALNLLSRERGRFRELDAAVLRQFGAHVAVALENARLFERERRDADAFETLSEIGREFASILDLEALLTKIAQLLRRVIDYRTFGILLLDETTGELEMKMAVQYGEKVRLPRLTLGTGVVGHAALYRQPVLVSDVARDPRYIKAVEDVRSELAIPLLLKERCIGVFDLESPELDAFDKRDVEILTVLASQAAVAIENARLYEAVRANELRLEKEVLFAQRVQAALLPADPVLRVGPLEIAGRFEPARELGGDLYDFLQPEPGIVVVAIGDVSGKGVPAALYGSFAGELVRSRTYRRRYSPERTNPADVLSSTNAILHERQLEEFYCTLCYAAFDLERRQVTLANSGLPYPIRCAEGACSTVVLPGLPLGSFAGSTYDEVTFPLTPGTIFVFCTDGVYDARNAHDQEFGHAGVRAIVAEHREGGAREIVEAIFAGVAAFGSERQPADDMTVVVVKHGGPAGEAATAATTS